MKNFKYLIIAFIAVIIIYIIWKKSSVTCYTLPKNVDPNVFGPYYWKAFHDVADKIPCDLCRPYAQKFMIFFHDVINKKLGKPLFNETNYNEVLATL